MNFIAAFFCGGMVMEICDLSKVYKGKKVLDIKKLHIEESRIYAIVGENGAGKTTLFRILAGLALPTSGTIEFASSNERLGVMIEQPALELNMTAEENLFWVSKVYGEENCQNIQKILELVRLSGEGKKVRRFSLGMKQRLGIAMSLLHSPNVLILDEPMNGLDPLGMIELRNILLKINKRGTTIVLSSHILEEVYKIATDYIFIKNGKVIQVNKLEDMEKMEEGCYEIFTSNNIKAKQVLKEKFECEVREENERLIFELKNENILSLSKCLTSEEVYILGLSKREFSIEAYYMEVVGAK